MWPFRPVPDLPSAIIDVLAPRVIERGRWRRVEAEVDGHLVWFATRDVPLAPAIEAFGSALLVPAMHAGRLLHLHAPACSTWIANATKLSDAFRELWYPEAPGVHAVPKISERSPAVKTALCFSGGVDSFHTLLTSGRAIEQLVYVLGYDVKLRERRRCLAVQRLVRQVAAETGTAAISIATNFRRHPLQKRTPWLRAFGGALAAVGHLLARDVGQLLMSSDGLGCEDPEVGSRVSTDLLHSSNSLSVVHYAAQVTRLEKLRVIGVEPLVQRHLRVCWKNVGQQLNCGRCEKCARTMIELDACGLLGRFAGFDRGRGLVAAIDGLPSVDAIVASFYQEALAAGLSWRLAAAVRRLLERSLSINNERPLRVAHEVLTRRRSSRVRRLLSIDAFTEVCQPLLGKRVGYVRPLGNVGDELIEMAMTQLFAEFGIRWSLCDPEQSADVDLLVFGGGGNMGGRYVNNYDLRRRALSVGLPLVVLPQSFTSPEEGAFERVYVRERESLRLHPTGILAPDLALGLAWPAPGRATKELGVFLRRDRERRGTRRRFFARDPVKLCKTVGPYLALAAAHRRIITDRLHFAIAGLHAGRDVTLLANDYHKNRSMHETWLASLGCRFAENLADAMASSKLAA